MSYPEANLLSAYQSNFGSSSSDDNGGWELTGGASGSGILFYDIPAYNTYIPGEQYKDRFKKASLLAISTGSDDLVVESPYFDVADSGSYMATVATMPFGFDAVYTINLDFYTAIGGSAVSHSTTTFTVSASEFELVRLMNIFETPATASKARMTITVAGDDLVSGDRVVFFDPFISNWSGSSVGGVAASVYNDLPTFMILDDENINDLVTGLQLPYPLRRFVTSLCFVADKVNSEAIDFRYDRATDGPEHKPTLTDPDTAKSSYLFWLASITGTNLLVSSSGFTPWVALELYEGSPVSGDPGEWEDLESLSDWLALQDVNPDFFDTVQSFRDQIRTGFTGVNAGRPDTIEAFVRTMLASETKDTDVVVIRNEDKDNPFRVEILVDPAVDPDPSGDLVALAVGAGLPAGVTVSKTSQVMESGRNSYDFDDVVYPATYSDSSAAGAVIYGKSFISDIDNYGRNLLLNKNSTPTTIPELGGGIADAHCSGEISYFYGDISGSSYGSLTTATSSLANLSVGQAYDIVMKITDVTRPTAPVATVADTGSTPPSWLFREKRLLVAGKDSGGTDNDWAIYMVSGLTPSSDIETRLLLVDGYMDEASDNYAYSDPIPTDVFSENKSMVVRVKKDSTNTCYFYAQNSIYDDWEGNLLGTASINPSSGNAGSDAYIQVLGQLNNSLWSDALPLSCAVERVMVFNDEIDFPDEDVSSAATHAYVDGEATLTYGVYTYSPTIDIDVRDANVYDTLFEAATRSSGAVGVLNVSVNSSSSNDTDLLAMRTHSTYGNLWYFGHTYGTGNGDTLSVTGLTSGNYDWVVNTIDTSTGAVSSASGSSTSVTEIDFSADTYGGQSILTIEIMTSGGTAGTAPNPGANVVAFFTPSTIASTDSSGIDGYSYTWEIDRTWPTGGAYAPSQVIDRNMIHMYESTPYINNPSSLEIYSSFSFVLQLRRLWSGTEGVDTYSILSALNSDSYGLHVYYDGPKIKVDFFDGTNTESVEWTEGAVGEWHNVVVRRNADGLSLVVDGVEEDTTAMALTVPFTNRTDDYHFSQGDLNEWNPRFALAQYAFFTRYLSDAEITLLESQI